MDGALLSSGKPLEPVDELEGSSDPLTPYRKTGDGDSAEPEELLVTLWPFARRASLFKLGEGSEKNEMTNVKEFQRSEVEAGYLRYFPAPFALVLRATADTGVLWC